MNRNKPSAARHLFAKAAIAFASIGLATQVRAQVTEPFPVDILQTSNLVAPGYLFISPNGPGGLTPLPNAIQGPEILDDQGRPVWFLALPGNQIASDFRVQSYRGQQVLTWSEGPGFEDVQPGLTTDYIFDNTYNVVATVKGGNGLNADEHEFQLTPQNTALITAYTTVPTDLSSLGGPVNGLVLTCAAQEIDVATGNVILDWRSIDHVALTESEMPVPTTVGVPYDYFHINSVKLDTDGNLLISARNTSTVYKVNRTTGAIIWRLGGKRSDFTLGAGLPFAFQHDAEAVNATTIRIFDNESDGVPVLPASRVIWVTHDDTSMTASLLNSIQHPAGLSALAEGSAQTLSNGDTLVDWGILGRYSEFDPSGNLIYDVKMATGYSSYRAYRLPWVAALTTTPSVSATYNSDGTTTVHAIWNGATGVASWSVMAGESSGSLSPAGSGPWNGLDTPVVVPGQMNYFQVVALDSSGVALGSSGTLGAAPSISAQPTSQTVSSGATVVFSSPANGPAVAYQWRFNGNPLSDGASLGALFSGSNGPTLIISGIMPSNAGSYTCVVTDAGGSATSQAAILAVSGSQDVGRLINVSVRALVGTGSNVLIAGFAVGGQQVTGSQAVLVRASGPALTQFDVSGVLPDPDLFLSGAGVAPPGAGGNYDWDGAPLIASTAAAVGAFAWTDPTSLDQATVQNLGPGPFSAVVSGQSGDTGIALAEVYDATPGGTYTLATPHLINVSARAQVGTGGNVLIAGFVIGGTTAKTVLIRASGPALLPFGIVGVLPDPELQLYSGSTVIESNTGWGGNAQISATAAQVGAFSWGTAATPESAILVTLAPGAYTAKVFGASGDTGVGLVEVYEVP
jgi:hypothetical protein